MILDDIVTIEIKSNIIVFKLKKLGISKNIGDVVGIKIDQLWPGSNIRLNVKCDICGNEKKLPYNLYLKNFKKYNVYSCSNKCSSFKNKITCMDKYGDPNFNNKEGAILTKLDKYGDPYFNNKKKTFLTKLYRYGDPNYNNIDKIKKTTLKNWGFTSSLMSPKIIDKIKNTNLEKYGVEDSRSSEFVKKKREETMLDRYGVESFFKSDEFKLKSKKTNIEKYGVEDSRSSELVKEKKKKTMLDRFGFENNLMSDICKLKLINTNLKRYGVKYPMQKIEFFNKQQENSKKIKYYNEKIYYQGSYEKDFLDFINNIGLIEKIDRGPTITYIYDGELKYYYPDFYIKDLNLIIEIKSSYFYNKYLDKNILKREKCIEMGYDYIFLINKNYIDFKSILEKKWGII